MLVLTNFPEKSTSLYVEKVSNLNQNLEDIYAAPDSLISQEKLVLQVSNFSSAAITIQVGQVLGKARNPDNWLVNAQKKLYNVQKLTLSYSGNVSIVLSIENVDIFQTMHRTDQKDE